MRNVSLIDWNRYEHKMSIALSWILDKNEFATSNAVRHKVFLLCHQTFYFDMRSRPICHLAAPATSERLLSSLYGTFPIFDHHHNHHYTHWSFMAFPHFRMHLPHQQRIFACAQRTHTHAKVFACALSIYIYVCVCWRNFQEAETSALLLFWDKLRLTTKLLPNKKWTIF